MNQQEVLSKLRQKEKRALSPEIAQLAEMHRLGRFTVHYTFMDYTTHGCLLALLFYLLSGLLFSAGIFLVFYAIKTGITTLSVLLLVFGVIPLLGLVYLSGKRVRKADEENSAYAYFYQQGFVYIHKEQQIVLRWEQIERVDMIYGLVRGCQIRLANGGDILLMNGVRGGLSEEIRRRVMRYRKKRQHVTAQPEPSQLRAPSASAQNNLD